MFTGLVECAGTVAALRRHDKGGSLTIHAGPVTGGAAIGDSIAVNGCCLTITALDQAAQSLSFDLLEQTLRVTNLGRLQPGDLINLERSLAFGARLGGHLVQGHIDSTSSILDFSRHGLDHRLQVALPPDFRGLVIPKGSICIDGISLTAAEVDSDSITCWIIPHTFEVTNLRQRRAGDLVNLEFDMIGKYVRSLARAALSSHSNG